VSARPTADAPQPIATGAEIAIGSAQRLSSITPITSSTADTTTRNRRADTWRRDDVPTFRPTDGIDLVAGDVAEQTPVETAPARRVTNAMEACRNGRSRIPVEHRMRIGADQAKIGAGGISRRDPVPECHDIVEAFQFRTADKAARSLAPVADGSAASASNN